MRFPITAAKFEKISYKQFAADCKRKNADLILDEIKMPARATTGSAGYDFYAPFDIVISPSESVVVPTGMRCRISDGFFLCILPRSGQGFRYALSLSNTAGIIDSDYYNAENEGHILIKLSNFHFDKEIFIPKGKGFAQGIFIPYGITTDDSATESRTGGFGSTT